ncbi:hypothetical protein WI23_23065 [Burkholderia oklahomensis C6786]|nr:hypothetical protein WI23_23065 [Burkholderia oklahomensis C6786]KUY58681.1 hypothetical protein WI23_17460 [Burkholderia oklahomensis C6786]
MIMTAHVGAICVAAGGCCASPDASTVEVAPVDAGRCDGRARRDEETRQSSAAGRRSPIEQLGMGKRE